MTLRAERIQLDPRKTASPPPANDSIASPLRLTEPVCRHRHRDDKSTSTFLHADHLAHTGNPPRCNQQSRGQPAYPNQGLIIMLMLGNAGSEPSPTVRVTDEENR